MSIFASLLRGVYRLTGTKKAFTLPESEILKVIEKQNRHRGVFAPTDRKAHYQTIDVGGFPCEIIPISAANGARTFTASSSRDCFTPSWAARVPDGKNFSPKSAAAHRKRQSASSMVRPPGKAGKIRTTSSSGERRIIPSSRRRITYDGLHPNLYWHRTKTLGRGDDCCDFCLKLVQK